MATYTKLPENIILVPGKLHVHGVGELAMLTYMARGEKLALIDTGISTTPEEYILPFLKEQNIPVTDIELLLITHAHFDHFGGNRTIFDLNPNMKICAHKNEYQWVEYHKRHFNEMYRGLEGEWDPDEAYRNAILRDCGKDTPVHKILDDYEIIDLGGGIELEVVPTPSHSPGHVVYYCKKYNLIISGDAIQGSETVFENGKKLMPLYHDARQYIDSLNRIKEIDPDIACTAHEGVLDRARIKQMMDDSFEFMDVFSERIVEILKAAGKPLTLRELTKGLHEKYYSGCDFAYQIFATTFAQCEYLKFEGMLRNEIDGDVLKWACQN